VEIDQGLHRCVRFARPGTSTYAFRLITWPGSLTIAGDTGTFSFRRLEDMFTFFRKSNPADIDYAYWAEKLTAADTPCGYESYDADAFRAAVARDLADYLEQAALDADATDALTAAVADKVLSCAHDGEAAAIFAAMQFDEQHEHAVFGDFYEHRLRAWTPQFVWCCLAIAWGIRQWDARIPRPTE
jgi:hypothetical protein